MDHYFFSGKKKDNFFSIIEENACCDFFFCEGKMHLSDRTYAIIMTDAALYLFTLTIQRVHVALL
jgi:hypothetical protein